LFVRNFANLPEIFVDILFLEVPFIKMKFIQVFASWHNRS